MALDTFTRAYIEALFFTDSEPGTFRADPDENPADIGGRVWDPETQSSLPGDVDSCDLAESACAAINADCERFQRENAALLAEACERDGYNMERAGHDFWLTRNGHGAGFWDRRELEDDSEEYEALTAAMVEASANGDSAAWDAALKARKALTGESLGDKLTKAAEAFGNAETYLGDDGLIYIFGREG